MVVHAGTINIAAGEQAIERQVVEMVEQMDHLGVFDLLRQSACANDNHISLLPPDQHPIEISPRLCVDVYPHDPNLGDRQT